MYAKPSGIGAEYMFCIHARTPSAAIAAIEPAAPAWLKSGLREKVGTISEITPTAPSTRIVWQPVKKIQLRCENRSGSPSSPASKNTPSKCRSTVSITSAASIAGPTTSRT